MLRIVLDFQHLADRQALYAAFSEQSHCPPGFGNNLDALWDWITGGMALPAQIHLHYLPLPVEGQFAPVIAVFEEAVQALEGELHLIRD
ncbi:barstar family protein [Pantoea sp. A4]|uniref:barstar family protein n=1 Tax=Pantoea sp. A4 TaxID=1225184 RepID=UPI00037677BE|nr:barstar family protein [Pantoea sp. A4]